MTTDRYHFLVSEQMGKQGRTTSILITEASSSSIAKQEFFEQFGKAALDCVKCYSRQEFIDTCSVNVVPWVIANLKNTDWLQPSDFSYKMQINTKFG